MPTTYKLPCEKFKGIKTPFYYYDTRLLQDTIDAVKEEIQNRNGYHVHYAVKACAHPDVLRLIQEAGLGADCVSGGE
ncbi:MAG: diaminopimelate decarboxylase, partial [Bacteroidaceae bacterium]|nr:diaminopimelate decarboxylase [Bacteroidaceae bacterium]